MIYCDEVKIIDLNNFPIYIILHSLMYVINQIYLLYLSLAKLFIYVNTNPFNVNPI